MSGQEVTYHQQMSFCGKPQCRKCRDGKGHGPYWYAYRTVDGKTTRTYIGKNLPADIQASLQGTQHAQRPLLTSPTEQASIRIYTLGQFRLERRDGTAWQTINDSAWQQQRVRAVLGYLISNDKRTMGREQMMDAVWPDADRETASHRLDRAVYTLRQLFEPAREKLATSPLLLTERDLLILGDQLHLWVDADAFESLLAQARASTTPSETEHILEEAATLYGGDFLPEESSNEWVLTRRGQLQRSWISLLLELADLRIGRDALTLAIEPLDRLLAHDPTSDAGVQRLIRIFAQLGRRGEALRAYKRLAAALYEEYKIAPLPETRALYDAVRRGSNDSMKRQEEKAERISGSTVHEDGTSTSSRSGALPRNLAPSLQIGRTHQSPLVGREQELAVLRDLLLTTENTAKFTLSGQKKEIAAPFAAQRRAQSVLLLGEVGIGKTRLAEELGRKARQRGWAVAWSRVYAQEGSIPYRLWIDVLRKALAQHGGLSSGLSSARPGQSQGAALSPPFPPQLLQRSLIYQPLATLLPELRSVLPEVALPSSPPPEQEQLRLWEAVRELLFAISETTPLLIVLDDLQWSDNGSYELLGYLARRLAGQPIIIIGTCRYNELSANSPLRPLLTDLQREHAVEALHLAPLSDEEIRVIVAELLTRTQDTSSNRVNVPEPTVQGIQSRAAGNPFFAEELARTVASQPDLADPPYALHPRTDGPPFLPETITAVLDLRLSRLNPACQRLLSRAAVLGGSFEFPIIAAMESGPSGGNEDVVLELLEEGLRSGMLSEEGFGSRVTYAFWHPLLVKHLYEGLSAARRASLHRRAAEILLRAYAPNEAEGAAIITHHLVRGGAHSDQIAYFAELAGDRAYSLSAYPDAERHYRTVQEHMSQHIDELEHRAYVLELLGDCTRIQGKYEEARRFYEQSLEVRNQRSAGTSQAEQQEAQIDALLWCKVGTTWYQTGATTQARQCYEHSERVLREAGVVSGPSWAKLHYEQSYAYLREGNYNEARAEAHEALKLFEEGIGQQSHSREPIFHSTSIRRTLAGDPANVGRTYSLLGTIEALAGRSSDAITHFQTALTHFEQYDCQREIAIVCCNVGDAYLKKADYAQAQAVLRRSLSIAERMGDIHLVTYIFGNLGMLDTRLGNLTEAETELRRSVTLTERFHDPISISFLHSCLATVLQEQGKLLDTKTTLSRALAVGRAVHIAPCIGLALVAIGSLRITQARAMDVDGESTASLHKEKIHLLKQAKKSLQRALAFEGLETETRIEGQLVQAQVSLLLGEGESALQQARQTLEEARLSELTWLVARAQRILGSIFAVHGEQEQTEKYFEQALRTFRRRGMRLEYGRTLQQYGSALMQQNDRGGKRYAQGMVFLQEARQLFTECQAMLDLRSVERVLAEHEQVKT